MAATLIRALSTAAATFATRLVNGQPGVVVSLQDRIMAAVALETDGVKVFAIRAIGNPEKLAHLNPKWFGRIRTTGRDDNGTCA